MKQTKCEGIRRELDELMLDHECSIDATQHLQDCGECREFQQKQTRLRQIVGGLGTVEAPPDFDFRLRARLANEANAAGFHVRGLQWPFATRGVAVAAMLLLFVGGVVIVRNVMNRERATDVASQQNEPPRPDERIQPQPREIGVTPNVPDRLPVVVSENGPRRVKGERSAKPKRPLVTLDSASEGASVISHTQRSAIFPIDTSLQALRFSIDDGYGNARTISVPTISFGSQRVLATGNQFAPKGVW